MSYRTRQPAVIWTIIVINLLFFVATTISDRLIFDLGLRRVTLHSQPWTFVTSMFTHVDLWHILFNMLTLYFFGTALLQVVGTKQFLITYLGGGLLGNLLFILLSSSAVVGASGAIFGVGGTLAVMRPRERVVLFPVPVPMQLWVAVVIGFVIVSFAGRVAWEAHLGGLIFGAVAGYFYRRRSRRRGTYWYG